MSAWVRICVSVGVSSMSIEVVVVVPVFAGVAVWAHKPRNDDAFSTPHATRKRHHKWDTRIDEVSCVRKLRVSACDRVVESVRDR